MTNSTNVPNEIKSIHQWVSWKGVKRENGKFTKYPYDPNKTGLVMARVNDLKTCGTFDQAVRHMVTHGLDGIGFVVNEHDQFVGIDLDDCVDPETGIIDEWAHSIVPRIICGQSH